MSWSWLSSDPPHCFQSPEAELIPTIGIAIRITLSPDSTSHNNSVEFNITQLDCNQMYLPRVRATLDLSTIQFFENGNEVFFGGTCKTVRPSPLYSLSFTLSILGSMRSPPAMLPRVCVGPSTSPQHQGRVNISWDPLPCHLQNGADVTSYIIQYTRLSTGVITRINSFHSDVQCSQEVSGLYSCVVAESLIFSYQGYSIQVAAVNNYGDGSFSDPINVSLPVSGRCHLKLWK